MSLDLIIFFISAIVAVFGAIMMIAQRNPVASVLYLILSFVAQAVLYVQLGALFVGAMLVIVYAGAILVLFLFVIMLLNLRGNEELGRPSTLASKLTKTLITGLLFLELLFIVRGVFLGVSPTGITGGSPTQEFGSIKSVSMLLFTKYLYPFELTGVLMLIAVVGAVVISRKETEESSAQDEAPAAPLIVPKSDEVIKG